jgi:hypothetical protein
MSKRTRDKSLVVSVKAFFDESAISPIDAPYLIMAGFVGSAGEFEKASYAWQECLNEKPAIPFFHHKVRSCQHKIPRLASLLQAHDLQAFVVTIPHQPFQNRDSRLSKGILGPRVYDWAFINTVMYVLGFVEGSCPHGETVDFTFENRREFDLCRVEFFEPLKAEGEGVWRRAGTCTSESDKKVAAIQMGDLLAGQALESIRLGAKTPAIIEIEKNGKILIFNKKPPDVIERNLTLHNLGGQLYQAGLLKILASPRESVDPVVYAKELDALRTIASIAMSDHDALTLESERLAEARREAIDHD